MPNGAARTNCEVCGLLRLCHPMGSPGYTCDACLDAQEIVECANALNKFVLHGEPQDTKLALIRDTPGVLELISAYLRPLE